MGFIQPIFQYQQRCHPSKAINRRVDNPGRATAAVWPHPIGVDHVHVDFSKRSGSSTSSEVQP
jgi:hypothetical protein